MAIKVIRLNTSQLMNVMHGLNMLDSDLKKTMSTATPLVVPYYKEKLIEIKEQILVCEKAIAED